MKKILLSIAVFIVAHTSLAQEVGSFSIELDANYYRYYLGEDHNNHFLNYGFSALLVRHFSKLKISLGANYSTKYYRDFNSSSFLIAHRDCKLNYLNYPLLFNFRVLPNNKSFQSSIMVGVWLNQILRYDVEYDYTNKEPKNFASGGTGMGVTFTTGFSVSKLLSKHIAINLMPCVNFKLVHDHETERAHLHFPQPYDEAFAESRFSFGLKLGVEYFFKSIE